MSANTLSKTTRELAPPANDGFDGKLRCPSLADLVQLECLSGARAAIEVSSNGRLGQLFFEQGALVHAKTEQSSGVMAALEILGWKTGTFGDSDGAWPTRRTIQLPWQELLLRAAQIADERLGPQSEDPVRSTSRLVRVASSRPPASPSVVPSTLLSVPSKKPEPVRAVRVDAGELLASRGEQVEEFVDLSAYLHRLVMLIGSDLGLSDFRELVWDRESSRLTLQAGEASAYVAIEAPKGADTSAVRRELEG
jgi:hypothetical protein